MKQRWGISFLVAVALASSVAAARAGMPVPGLDEVIARDLALSEAQQEKLREIMDEQRKEREALYDKISANRDALHQLLESGGADANAVGELVLQGRKLHEQGQALRQAEQKAIRAILNPEQQRKFDEVLAQRRERGPGRGPEGFRGQPPGGPGMRQPRPPLGQGKPGQRPGQP
jgi:Spy/CpxP family protein refolding chaperone